MKVKFIKEKPMAIKIKRAKPFAASLQSTKHMEAEGWSCWKVESIVPYRFIKIDCFNFGDILAISPSRGIALVQSTGGKGISNFNARLKKIKENPYHAIWLASGGRIILHSWEGVGKIRALRLMEITKEESL